MSAPSTSPVVADGGFRRAFDLPGFGRRTFRFPTVFHDSLAVAAIFPCDIEAARQELGPGDLEPLPIAPRTTCAIVTAYRHRAVAEMEPYGEMLVLVPARKRGAGVPPLLPLWMRSPVRGFGHVPLAMPLDSDLNRARGVGIWGLPKYLADVAIAETPTGLEIRVAEGGRTALRFFVPAGGRARFIDLRVRLWCAAGPACATQRGQARVHQALRSLRPAVRDLSLDARSKVGGLLARLDVTRGAIESRVIDHLEMKLDLPVRENAHNGAALGN